MKLIVFSDLHGNAEALDKLLAVKESPDSIYILR